MTDLSVLQFMRTIGTYYFYDFYPLLKNGSKNRPLICLRHTLKLSYPRVTNHIGE